MRLGIALISVSLHYEWRAMEIAIHERVLAQKAATHHSIRTCGQQITKTRVSVSSYH